MGGILITATDSESVPLSEPRVREFRNKCDSDNDIGCLIDIDERSVSQQLCTSAQCVSMYDAVFKKSVENSDAYVIGTPLGKRFFEIPIQLAVVDPLQVVAGICERAGLEPDSEMCNKDLPFYVQGYVGIWQYELRARRVALSLKLVSTNGLRRSSSAWIHACRSIMRLWYQDSHNLPSSSDPVPGNASLTFIIPAKLRPLMLLQTVLNLYGKAAHKECLFVHVVLYANDELSLRVIPLLEAISPNVVIRLNTLVEVGYDDIEHLYRLGAEGIQTTLQAVYSDRAHVMTLGFDSLIYQAYLDLQQPTLAVLFMYEMNTWFHAYPILTTTLDHLVEGGAYQSPAIDGFLKYLGQCSGIMVDVEEVLVWRLHVQQYEAFKTPSNQTLRKEVLFRKNVDMKNSLLAACLAVIGHDEYRELDPGALAAVQSSWLHEPFIFDGPTGKV